MTRAEHRLLIALCSSSPGLPLSALHIVVRTLSIVDVVTSSSLPRRNVDPPLSSFGQLQALPAHETYSPPTLSKLHSSPVFISSPALLSYSPPLFRDATHPSLLYSPRPQYIPPPPSPPTRSRRHFPLRPRRTPLANRARHLHFLCSVSTSNPSHFPLTLRNREAPLNPRRSTRSRETPPIYPRLATVRGVEDSL
jgi:hypothetical protein